MTVPSNNRKPTLLALAASALLTILIVAGSRNLEHYDSALFGYTVASVVAFGAIVFRYAIWLQRPATRVYWRRGWKLYLQKEKFAQNTADAGSSSIHAKLRRHARAIFIFNSNQAPTSRSLMDCGTFSSKRIWLIRLLSTHARTIGKLLERWQDVTHRTSPLRSAVCLLKRSSTLHCSTAVQRRRW